MSDPRPDKPVEPTPLDHAPYAPSTAATLVAEGFGTFLLVLGVISTALFAAGFGEGTEAANKGVGFLGVSLAVGITVIAGAYAFGPISGGHFNPAVTFGLAAAGRFPWKGVLPYVIAQIVGGAIATTLIVLIGLFGPDIVAERTRRTAASPATAGIPCRRRGFGIGAAIIVEVLFTALFVIVILGVTHATRGTTFAGLAIGLTLVLIHLAIIPIDNASVNPARSIATAIYGGPLALSQLWVFLVFPIVGALIAGFSYKALFDGTQKAGADGDRSSAARSSRSDRTLGPAPLRHLDSAVPERSRADVLDRGRLLGRPARRVRRQSARDEPRGARLVLGEVAGLPRPRRATADEEHVEEERPERQGADADLHRPRPRLPRHEALDQTRHQQGEHQPHGHRRERPTGRRRATRRAIAYPAPPTPRRCAARPPPRRRSRSARAGRAEG